MANNIKKIDIGSGYQGGKGGSGVYQNIINKIPPHDTYIETHLGGGSIMKKKRRASINVGIDIDPEVKKYWDKNRFPGYIIVTKDACRWLKEYPFMGREFVYLDPPYLKETRKSGNRDLYNYEMTRDQHIELLTQIKKLPCKVMISGYFSSLYEKMLPGWNTFSFQATTRQGTATEWLWMNYPEPTELHDYKYLGKDFRERERIKKKRDRWLVRLDMFPFLERKALMLTLNGGGA